MPEMDDFTAIDIIESGDATEDEYLAAFQQLVNSGIVWKLQGVYGRWASRLLDAGLITYPVEQQPS